ALDRDRYLARAQVVPRNGDIVLLADVLDREGQIFGFERRGILGPPTQNRAWIKHVVCRESLGLSRGGNGRCHRSPAEDRSVERLAGWCDDKVLGNDDHASTTCAPSRCLCSNSSISPRIASPLNNCVGLMPCTLIVWLGSACCCGSVPPPLPPRTLGVLPPPPMFVLRIVASCAAPEAAAAAACAQPHGVPP